MSINRILFLVIFASVITFTSSIFCNCPYAPIIDSVNPIADISADENATRTVNITGIVIDSRGYLVIAPFRVIIRNIASDQYLSETFENGMFNVSITIPSFATENQTLEVNVTSLDGSTEYGGTLLLLANIDSTPIYEVEVFIASPPPNYNWLWVILFVVAFGIILAAYAVFTRWMIGKMVIKKANQIRLDDWRRKGGGQMKP